MEDSVLKAKPCELKEGIACNGKKNVIIVLEKLDELPIGMKEVSFQLVVNGCYYGEKIKGRVIVEDNVMEKVEEFKKQLGITNQFADKDIENALKDANFDFQITANNLFERRE